MGERQHALLMGVRLGVQTWVLWKMTSTAVWGSDNSPSRWEPPPPNLCQLITQQGLLQLFANLLRFCCILIYGMLTATVLKIAPEDKTKRDASLDQQYSISNWRRKRNGLGQDQDTRKWIPLSFGAFCFSPVCLCQVPATIGTSNCSEAHTSVI